MPNGSLNILKNGNDCQDCMEVDADLFNAFSSCNKSKLKSGFDKSVQRR